MENGSEIKVRLKITALHVVRRILKVFLKKMKRESLKITALHVVRRIF